MIEIGKHYTGRYLASVALVRVKSVYGHLADRYYCEVVHFIDNTKTYEPLYYLARELTPCDDPIDILKEML